MRFEAKPDPSTEPAEHLQPFLLSLLAHLWLHMQICICATQLSQLAALKALQLGEEYKKEMIATLEGVSLTSLVCDTHWPSLTQ